MCQRIIGNYFSKHSIILESWDVHRHDSKYLVASKTFKSGRNSRKGGDGLLTICIHTFVCGYMHY